MSNSIIFWQDALSVYLDDCSFYSPGTGRANGVKGNGAFSNLGGRPASRVVTSLGKCPSYSPAGQDRMVGGQQPEQDGYLLLLLADQERAAGRDEQALVLIEAAYSAFDEQVGALPGIFDLPRQNGSMA